MRCLAPQVLVVLLVVGSACCTPPNPLPNAVNAPAYVCQWSKIEVTQGLSVVTDGDPSNKSVEELYKKGAGFRVKSERTMECQAIEPPEELKKLKPEVISAPPKKRKPRSPPVQYINHNIDET